MNRFDRLRVLLVDDSADMRALMRGILGGLGVRDVVEAADAEACFAAMRGTPPDLAFVDWLMEPVDGLELTRRIRNDANSPNVYLPIVMVTGHSEPERVKAARDAGVTEFLVKPVSSRSVFQRLVAIIEQPRPFVRTPTYFGPDRRRQNKPFDGPDRRRSKRGGQAAAPELEMKEEA
jgi:two-component system, chemotaxis family, chemotaxis protein CheY